MRSRYCAYVLELEDYLLATWHPATAPKAIEFANTQWLKLTIQRTETTGASGLVEFIAEYKESGRFRRLHEVSHFLLVHDRWFYERGDIQA